MNDILELEGWKKNKLSTNYEDSQIRSLEDKATILHNEIDALNSVILEGGYVINTRITGVLKDNYYNLNIRIKYYEQKSEHKRKKNTHFQKIHI